MKNSLIAGAALALFALAWLAGRAGQADGARSPVATPNPTAPSAIAPARAPAPAVPRARAAPPRFASPPARPDNEWARQARQQTEEAQRQEEQGLAALDALGPRIGPPPVVDTLRRWIRQAATLRRQIFAEPLTSAQDLEGRYDRLGALLTAHVKAQKALLGEDGFRRYHHLAYRFGQGAVLSDERLGKELAPKDDDPGVVTVRHREIEPVPPVDTREFDRYFAQR